MLIGNGALQHKMLGRFQTGTSLAQDTPNFCKSGAWRNRLLREVGVTQFESTPLGNGAGAAWVLPNRLGGLASRNEATGAGNFTGSGSLGVNVQTILTGEGNITSAIAALVVSAVAILTGQGNLTSAIVGKLEAAAAMAGAGNVQGAIGAIASMLATASGTGSLTALQSAIGSLAANIKGYGDLTPEGLRDAVWGAIAANNNAAGTMGNKLNSAASGGVDYPALATAVRTELQAELLRIIEIAKLHGLVIGSDLVVTETARTAGTVVQTIATAGSTTTVRRQP